jgi:hypothetical protein
MPWPNAMGATARARTIKGKKSLRMRGYVGLSFGNVKVLAPQDLRGVELGQRNSRRLLMLSAPSALGDQRTSSEALRTSADMMAARRRCVGLFRADPPFNPIHPPLR